MHDVFISYSTQDQFDADLVKRILESNEIICWMAPGSIPPGSNYAREIPNAIRNAKIFLLLLSRAAQASNWVPIELTCAINDQKVIIPFMLENCELTEDFVFYLSRFQRLPAYQQRQNALKQLVIQINSILYPVENRQPKIAELSEVPVPTMPEYSGTTTEDQVENFVKAYIERDVIKSTKIFQGGNIKKLRQSLMIPEADTVFLAHDDSLFRNGKCGFALCSSGIYYRDIMESATYVDWQTFLKFQHFELRGAIAKCDIYGCTEDESCMVAYFNTSSHEDQMMVIRFFTRLSEALRRVFA